MLSGIKSKLPWWSKIAAKMLLARMPIGYQFWQRMGLFRHGNMDAVDYALGIFDGHVKRLGWSTTDIRGKRILEIGPGDSIATAIIAFSHGAEAILLDSGPYARTISGPYIALSRALALRGLRSPDLSGVRTINDILDACKGVYLTEGLASWQEIDSDSVDFVFSQAVLEHIRKHEFLATQNECRRVMRSDAIATHRIDLRDHLGGALNNLRFSARSWESDWFVKSGFYTNRLRMSEMLCVFEQAGFDFEVAEVRRWSRLPTPRNKLDKEFSSLSEEELNVSGFDVLLRCNMQDVG